MSAHRICLLAAISILSLHIGFLSVSAQDSVTLTLRDCEQMALRNSQSLKQAGAKLEFSRARAAQAAHAAILPQLELKNTWGPISRARALTNEYGVLLSPDTTFTFDGLRYFTEVEVNLLQPIYTFGKLRNLRRAADFGALAEESAVEGARGDVLFQVREAYWSLLLAKELLLVVNEARDAVDKAQRKIDEKLDEGSEDVSQTDIFKLQIFEYEVNKQLRQAQDDSVLAESKLRMQTGLPAGTPLAFSAEYLEPLSIDLEPIDVYLQMAAGSRPDVTQIQSGLRAREALIGVARSDYFPQFFLGAQAKYNYAPDRFDSKNPFVYNPTNFFRPGIVVGLNMNLNYAQTRSKVRMEEAEYAALSHKSGLLNASVKLDVRQAFLAAGRAETNVRESRKALKASDNWLRSATMTFDLGVGEVKDLIDAFQANGRMKAEHLRNIYGFNMALARLSIAVGRDLYPNASQ